MIVSIWSWLNETSDHIYNFIMNKYEEPFFWMIMFGVLLLIGLYAIKKFADK